MMCLFDVFVIYLVCVSCVFFFIAVDRSYIYFLYLFKMIAVVLFNKRNNTCFGA